MIKIFTRSMNEALYKKASEFWPDLPKEKCTQFHGWHEAAYYLYHVIKSAEQGVEWAINIDEDCFIKDWKAIDGIIKQMETTGASWAGMPDGGVCKHRNWSWCIQNPFFNVFNVKLIYAEFKKYNEATIAGYDYKPAYDVLKPEFIGENYSFSQKFEYYYGFFYWLLEAGLKPLYLNAKGFPDGISTELMFNNKVFCVHTWYSREYKKDEFHTKRINNVYHHAKACLI